MTIHHSSHQWSSPELRPPPEFKRAALPERLCNLGELPPDGFQVACFPLRIVGASAAPARVVAILP